MRKEMWEEVGSKEGKIREEEREKRKEREEREERK